MKYAVCKHKQNLQYVKYFQVYTVLEQIPSMYLTESDSVNKWHTDFLFIIQYVVLTLACSM